MLGMIVVFSYCRNVDSFRVVLVLTDYGLYHQNPMERRGFRELKSGVNLMIFHFHCFGQCILNF